VYVAVVILTVLVAAVLVVVILLQSSKGSGLSATFGGAGGEAMLSSRQAATVLHKLTIYLVAVFMFLCLLATLISGRRDTGPVTVTSAALEENSSTFNPGIPVQPLPTPGAASGTAPAGVDSSAAGN
jgi:preprotein translocase subunit SecG